ncbi:MAG TPA: hypothetical protein DCX03_02350 [Bacteroidales bacterium]|jgi:trigger factor|nr:hypothetical protein [Bacteroidales bacterium]
MEIIKEDTGELTATLHLKLSKQDYLPQVEAELKKLQRDAFIPGFRKGKVPMGHLKKLYGDSLIMERINKFVSESLNQYIIENQLPIIGYPISNPQNKPFDVEFDQADEHEFLFDIGLTPEIEIDFSELQPIKYYLITPSQTDIDRQIEELRDQFAELVEIESADEEAIIEGKVFEIDDLSSPKENGYEQFIRLDLKDEALPQQIKDKLLGIKKDQIIDFLFDSAEDLARFIRIDFKKAKEIHLNLQFKVSGNFHKRLPELNPDFFHQVFPEQNIETLEEFRAEAAKKVHIDFLQNHSDKTFYWAIMQQLLNHVNIPLPEDFLKRWIAFHENMHSEEVNKNLDKFVESIRMEILRNHLIKKAEIKINEEEIRNYFAHEIIAANFPYFQYNNDIIEKITQVVNVAVDEAMQNEKDLERAKNELTDVKLIDFLKSNLPLEVIEIDTITYIDSLSPKQEDKALEEQAEEKTEIMDNNTENQKNNG